MADLFSINLEKSLKIYKIILNSILIANLISSAIFVIWWHTWEHVIIFTIISSILYFFISYIISHKLLDSRLEDSFKSIKSLNIFSFILIILFYFPVIILLFPWVGIIYLILFCNCYNVLKKKEIYNLLRKYFILGFISYAIGGFFTFLSIIVFNSYSLYMGPGFVLFGIFLMNMKVIPYISQRQSEKTPHLEKIRRGWPKKVFYRQNIDSNIEPVQEIKDANAEFESEFTKISKKPTKEEVIEQFYEPINQQEILINNEIPQITLKSTILEEEKTEIEISPQNATTKRFGLLNLRNNLKKISEKPNRNLIFQKKAKSHVPKKKCPFCGKDHEDLNTPFCQACGYKF